MADKVVWVIPYAGEPVERLHRTVGSALAAGGDVFVSCDGVDVDMSSFTRQLGDDVCCTFAPKRGCAATVNAGADLAIKNGATHLAFLDTGDTVSPDRLKFYHPTKPSFCYTMVPGRGVVGSSPHWASEIWVDNQFCASSTIVPVDAWIRRTESLTYCSDWGVAVRIQHRVGWVQVPWCLVTANEYPDGLTKTADHARRASDRAWVARMARELRKTL